MKKRNTYLIALTSFILAMALIATTSALHYDNSGVICTVQNGEVVITAFSDLGGPSSNSISIPAYVHIDGYGQLMPVTRIQEGAFSGCSSLRSISLPYTVRSVGSHAFSNCINLISASACGNKIEAFTFAYCSRLSSIVIPSSATSIGISAFMNCESLVNIEIPVSVNNIGANAFKGCQNLTDITIWNKDCYISDDCIPSITTIHGHLGSTAQIYANEHGISFEIVDCSHRLNKESTVKTPATCENEGVETRVCSRCGDAVDVSIPALGHDLVLSTIAIAPTCTASGIGRYTCTRCEATKVDVIPATGHTEVEIPAVPVTCTTDGTTAGVKCAVCNEVFTAPSVIPATGHTEVEIPAVAATCMTDGATVGVRCSVCNAILTAPTVIPATGHSEVALAAVPASCTESGLTAGVKCSVCNEILVAQKIIPALGHSFRLVETYMEPTPDMPGMGLFVCTRCGETKYDDIPWVQFNVDVTLPTGSAVMEVSEKAVTSGDTFTAISARAAEKAFEMHSVTYTGADGLDCTADFALDVPQTMNAARVKVYRIASDFITDLAAELGEDGKLHFSADHLDEYVICEGELVKYGDTTGDGQLTIADTLRLFRSMTDDKVSMDIAAADFSGDEQITMTDALMILRQTLSR